MNDMDIFASEWRTLHDSHEQYEKSALLIKLACLALGMAGLAAGVAPLWIGVAVLLCWVQEGILKTWQGRLGERLLRVEARLREGGNAAGAMQLYSDWSATRTGGAALLAGYARSACRPTVAFPYLPILLLGGLA